MIYFLIIILGAAVCVSLIFWIVNWVDDTPFDDPKIKFKSFVKFYNINPDRWELNSGYVRCRIKNTYGGWSSASDDFRFGPIDYLRYQHFRNTLDKRRINATHAKSIARMLNAVKEDIAATEELAKREQEEALKTLKEKLHVTL